MAHTAEVVGYIEHFEPTAVEGWALRLDGKQTRLTLRAGGNRYSLRSRWL
ncbi:MAG: hypothetical protein V2I51_22770 [Anderseniella sp.]|nr:hypothetical protein [Anderseniella sp.]